jgi:hypothetical protein
MIAAKTIRHPGIQLCEFMERIPFRNTSKDIVHSIRRKCFERTQADKKKPHLVVITAVTGGLESSLRYRSAAQITVNSSWRRV